MINFASLFSQFRNTSNSAISELLEQPNIELPRLLDEDSFVNEFKSGNNKLMDFMKYDKFETLVEYITVVGPADDRRRSYKFPLSASDILSSENNSVSEYFFPEGQLYLEEVTYEEQEVEEEVPDESAQEEQEMKETIEAEPVQPQTKEEENKTEQPQKTIIQENLETAVEIPEQAQKNTQKTETEETSKESEEKQENKSEKQDTKQKKASPKKTKMVKSIKKVQKVNKKPVVPLINKLYEYFSGEINYTLAGYVCKVMGTLLTKKPTAMLKYVLNPEKRKQLLDHVESRSVAEFIVKVLTFESTEFLEERGDYYREIIAELGVDAQVFKLSNLSSCVVEAIEKVVANLKGNNVIKEFSTLFFSPEDIASVINNVMSQYENVSVYNAPVLFSYLTNVPLNSPQNQVLLQNFQKIIEGFIGKALQKLKVTRKERRGLGIGRVKILEIITFILKENILDAREIISRKAQFFNILFELCRNYDMNNVLHNEVVKIAETAMSLPSDSAFLKSLIENDLLLNFLEKEYKEDELIKAGQTDRKTRKGFIGHVVQLCQKVNEYAQKNDLLLRLSERPQFQAVMKNLVDKETFQANKNLAGYSMRRGVPQKIMFQKEEVISEYITFLSKSPAPVYEPESEPVNIEQPDLIEELQKQLQENVQTGSNQGKEDSNQEKQRMEQELANPKYWIKHLDYDIEDVMNDL